MKKYLYAVYLDTTENYGISDTVVPFDTQYVSQTAKVKGSEAPLLSGIVIPSRVAIEQDADYA